MSFSLRKIIRVNGKTEKDNQSLVEHPAVRSIEFSVAEIMGDEISIELQFDPPVKAIEINKMHGQSMDEIPLEQLESKPSSAPEEFVFKLNRKEVEVMAGLHSDSTELVEALEKKALDKLIEARTKPDQA